MRLSLNRPVIKIKTHNCCAEDLPQVRQVQVPEGVQGLPPGEEGSVRAGVGHVELTRAVQGRGEGEDEGGVAQGGGAGAQGPPPARVGKAELWTQELEVRGDFKYVIVDGKYVKLRGGGVLLIAWDSRRTV